MSQLSYPFLFMRGGTSRGPFFLREDLPQDLDALAKVLIAVVGSGHKINIDGIGGGTAVTTKVAMLSTSSDDWADIDYFFAQVSVEDQLVDFKPTCGNILSAVGPAALEMGLVKPKGDITRIKIRAVNTGANVVAEVQTPDGELTYEGDTQIAGAPGTAAPVALKFKGVVGSSTGAFLPTGNFRDSIDGIEVTCMDVAMPLVIARAADLGLSGHESAATLDENTTLFKRLENIRCQAALLMGMGDVSKSVMPKIGLLAPAERGGTVAARYFMPWTTHPSMAVTGSQCLASCALTPGTIADGMITEEISSPTNVVLEHPSGTIEVMVEFNLHHGFELESAGLVRTVRKLAEGKVFVPHKVLNSP